MTTFVAAPTLRSVLRIVRQRRRSGARILILALVGDDILLSLGTALAEGWVVFDGLYYGMASLSTVGFGDGRHRDLVPILDHDDQRPGDDPGDRRAGVLREGPLGSRGSLISYLRRP